MRFLCLILLFILKIKLFHCTTDFLSDEFIDKQLLNIQEDIIDSLQEQIRIKKDTEVYFQFHGIEHYIISNPSIAFEIFNTTCVLVGNRIFTVSFSTISNKFIWQPHSFLTKIHNEVLFIKSIEYEKSMLLVVTFTTGYSNIYLFELNKWTFMQTIKTEANIIDCSVFYFKNHLYLFAAINNNLSYSTKSILYEWSGTHFDEIDSVNTKGASSVETFEDDDFVIVVITQNSRNHEVGTLVYKFDHNGLKKIQYLQTYGAIKAYSYEYDNGIYLVICNTKYNSMVFLWNGHSFIKWLKFDQIEHFEKTSLQIVSDQSLLFVVNPKCIYAYHLTSSDVYQLPELCFDTGIKWVLSMQTVDNIDYKFLFMTGISQYDQPEIYFLPFDTQTIRTSRARSSDNNVLNYNAEFLYNSFKSIQEKLEERGKLINDLWNEMIKNGDISDDSTNIVNTNSELNAKLRSGVNQNVDETDRIDEIRAEKRIDDIRGDADDFLHTEIIEDIADRFEWLRKKAQCFSLPSDDSTVSTTIQCNRNIVVRGNLYANNIETPAVYVKTLNGRIWEPSTWLLNNTDQHINLKSREHENFMAKNVQVNDEDSLLHRVIFHEGDQKLPGIYTLDSLTANNLQAQKINSMDFTDLYLKKSNDEIAGEKIFQEIYSERVNFNRMRNKNSDEIMPIILNKGMIFGDSLNVENLNARIINGLNWTEFRNSVFMGGKENVINGDLVVNADLYIDELKTDFISGIDTEKLFTTSTNQIIPADIKFTRIVANEINCNDINGIDISHEAANTIDGRIITGPLSVKNITVLGNLTVRQELLPNIEKFPNRKDFQQFYEGHVKINGNIFIDDLDVHHSCNMHHQNEPFNFTHLKKEYWLKNTDQDIRHTVAFANLNVSDLHTNYLNGIDVDRYIKTTTNIVDLPNFTFKQLKVYGNISTNIGKQQESLLRRLIEETVKKTGRFIITSQKTYTNEVTINYLKAKFINNEIAEGKNTVHQFGHLKETQRYDKIIIKNDVHLIGDEEAIIKNINNVNLEKLINQSCYIHKDCKINHMTFKNITVNNLEFLHINGFSVEDLLSDVSELYSHTKIKKLFINSDVTLEKANISYINSVHVDEYLPKIVLRHKTPIVIEGTAKFLGKTHVKHLNTNVFNGIHLDDMMNHYLSRTKNQTIHSKYTFKNVSCHQLVTNKMNNIDTVQLINVKSDEINIVGQLAFVDLFVYEGIHANKLNCNLQDGLFILKNPIMNHFSSVTATNAYFAPNTGLLSTILYNLVHYKVQRPIFGKVTIEHLSAETINMQNPIINDLNLQFLFDDALMRNLPHQVVTGRKTFRALQSTNVSVLGNSNVDFINDINVLEFNSSLICKEELGNVVIRGNKIFEETVAMKNLQIPDKIHDVYPYDLVSLANPVNLTNAHFKSLEITENLNINYINGRSINEFLNKRFLVHTDYPQYITTPITFDNLHIIGDSYIKSINHMEVDDIVTDEGIQNIYDSKRFTQPVYITGNIHVELLNGININEAYNNAILNENKTIEIYGDVIFKDSVAVNEDINATKLNGVEISYLDSVLSRDINEIRNSELTNQLISDIEENIDRLDFKYSGEQEHLYIEESHELDISIPNSVDAQVLYFGPNVQLNIVAQETGDKCGLPLSCFCPTQYTIHITPQMTYDNLIYNNSHRIFSYYDGDNNYNLLTNSVSSSAVCRLDDEEGMALENTYITWHNVEHYESYIKNIFDTGYISDAKFFTLNGVTYLVLIRFYDPIHDTHNLECVIMKQSSELTELDSDHKPYNDFIEIQTIETKGAWSLDIFNTARGVTLIIGNIYDSKTQTTDVDTEIYRFVEDLEKFVLLKLIPSTGCKAVIGISTSATEDMIALAYENYITVLKYNEEKDDYLAQQRLEFHSQIIGVKSLLTKDNPDEAFLITTTYSRHFYVYTYKYMEGWKLKFTGNMDGVQTLIPFVIHKQIYFFAPSLYRSKILRLATQGIVNNRFN